MNANLQERDEQEIFMQEPVLRLETQVDTQDLRARARTPRKAHGESHRFSSRAPSESAPRCLEATMCSSWDDVF
uniref:Uncharacterized protein n=1 Tax=Nephroselmis olivacea TaxID=31312 RepID=Q9T3R4_NEPOL|nr:hypothetical protein NeolCp093 [Nephroselmis olivacea]NP_050949.1 hypothetical protein NeolCp144 [Nephroselmis olivacea]AAD54869.1 unknown [Nephroselmis olivacea]AAD54920.1 unknown [Nephroselmis olivacea]